MTKMEYRIVLTNDEQVVIEHDSKDAENLWLMGAKKLGFFEIGNRIYPWHSVQVIRKKARRY